MPKTPRPEKSERGILVINAGSSSIKAGLFRQAESLLPVCRWMLENPLAHRSSVTLERHDGMQIKKNLAGPLAGKLATLLQLVAKAAEQAGAPLNIHVVGHRIVHGGRVFQTPTLLTSTQLKKIESLGHLAPLHNPLQANIARLLARALPGVPQVGVFDTAYFSNLPEMEKHYPLPRRYFLQGLQRYGFHGIAHQTLASQAVTWSHLPKRSARIVTCHLGNGCSLTASRNGRSLKTTMGFTPTDGLMMGTRSGSLDPNLILHMLRSGSCTVDDAERIINRGSGLLGVSGLSNDMRILRAAARRGHAKARLALDMFAGRLEAGIAAMATAMGGLDVLVFSGGIGENDHALRAAACKNLAFMGISVDARKNRGTARHARTISKAGTPVRVIILPASEEAAIAGVCAEMQLDH